MGARDNAEVHVWIPDSMLQRTHDHKIVDAPLATSVAARGFGPTKKTRIASYFGNQWVAEREGDELVIYHVGTGLGSPVDLVGGSAGDGAPGRMTALKYQQQIIEPSRRATGGR